MGPSLSQWKHLEDHAIQEGATLKARVFLGDLTLELIARTGTEPGDPATDGGADNRADEGGDGFLFHWQVLLRRGRVLLVVEGDCEFSLFSLHRPGQRPNQRV